METLGICLFAGMRLTLGGTPLPPLPTQRSKSLLAYLVLHRHRRFSRGVLCGLFWAERNEAEARRALRTELWRIRTVLRPQEAPEDGYLITSGDELGFNASAPHWLDIEEFESRLDAVARGGRRPPADERQLLEEAIDLYVGDLLEGEYDEWCCAERERLRSRFLWALERLAQHHFAHNQWNAAIAACQRLLRCDPLLEHVHRDLMRCHYLAGNRAAALRQFALCHDVLGRELDVEPMPETQELYQSIRTGRRDRVVRKSEAS